ncbi:MAG: hypothetical protein ACFFDN_47050 [Candidatus Hodarchaeota archaeon]
MSALDKLLPDNPYDVKANIILCNHNQKTYTMNMIIKKKFNMNKLKIKALLSKIMNISTLEYAISYIVAFMMIALLAWKLGCTVSSQSRLPMANWTTFSMAPFGGSVNLRPEWAARPIPTESWILFSTIMKQILNFLVPSWSILLTYNLWFFVQLTILSCCATLCIMYVLKDKHPFLVGLLKLFPLVANVNCLLIFVYYFGAVSTTILTYDLPTISFTFLLFTSIFSFLDRPNKRKFVYLILFIVPLIFVKETLLLPVFILIMILLMDNHFSNNKYYSVSLLLTLAFAIGLQTFYVFIILKLSPLDWFALKSKYTINNQPLMVMNLNSIAGKNWEGYALKNPLIFISPIILGIILLRDDDMLDDKKRLLIIVSSFLFVLISLMFGVINESRLLLEYSSLIINLLLSKKVYSAFLENSGAL